MFGSFLFRYLLSCFSLHLISLAKLKNLSYPSCYAASGASSAAAWVAPFVEGSYFYSSVVAIPQLYTVNKQKSDIKIKNKTLFWKICRVLPAVCFQVPIICFLFTFFPGLLKRTKILLKLLKHI